MTQKFLSLLKNYKVCLGEGVYAPGAIRSIAFDKKAVAVDGNVKRVLAGIMDFLTLRSE